MRNTRLYVALMTIAVLTLGACSAGAVDRVRFHSHDIELVLDVPAHSARITDSGRLTVTIGWNLFYLNSTAQIGAFGLDGEPVDFHAATLADSAELPAEVLPYLREFEADVPALLVLFQTKKIGGFPFSVEYTAEFFEDVSKMRFSRERVGGEVSGTITEQGAYLSPGAYYYPSGEDELMDFHLTADVPDTWESVSDGNRLSSEIRDGRKTQSWGNPFKSDGCMFMAAPYVTKSTVADSVEIWCYFFEADTGLFETYLPATADYIKMYSELIGPYPYKRFTVAENFFSTGYGMPAWTLLGQRVLQMPWIVKTSLGHEVLHNWWGNSVYVDYDRGNWCEGLTVYGADYRYKLLESEEAAKTYRKDILKQYLSYVDEGNDFPLREFTSRSSPDTRSIGYGKCMMVFHMIEEEIGTEPFFEAWKLVYKRHIGEKIGWEEWIAAYEETSGKDLSHIIPQWIDRAGAPMLSLDTVIATIGPPQSPGHYKGDSALQVAYRVSQDSEPLRVLLVPYRFSGSAIGFPLEGGSMMRDSIYGGSMQLHPIPSSFEIDPDYHLFRRLYPEEVEPIVSSVLGKDERCYFTADGRYDVVALFAEFGTNLEGDSIQVQRMSAWDSADQGCAQVVMNPKELPEYLRSKVTLSAQTASIQGADYPRKGHTLVLTGQDWDGHDRCMVIITSDFRSLPRLGQLIPHYGKYSFLVFQDARNVGKGQWEVTDSPLKVTLP